MKNRRSFNIVALITALLVVVFADCGRVYAGGRDSLWNRVERYSIDSLLPYIMDMSIYPSWVESGGKEYVFFTEQGAGSKQFFIADPVKKSKTKLFDNVELARKLSAFAGEDVDAAELGFFPSFDKKEAGVFYFREGDARYKYNFVKGELSEVENTVAAVGGWLRGSEPSWKRFCPDSTYYIWARNHDLYLRKTGATDSVRLTDDGARDFSFASGYGDFASGGEGADAPVSPRGVWLVNSHAFYVIREDRRQVGEMSVINSLDEPRPTTHTYKYTISGDKHVAQYDMLMVNADSMKAWRVDLAKYPDQKLEIPLYSNVYRDPRYVWLLRKSRTCDRIDLVRVDSHTGVAREIISEQTLPHYNEQLFRYYILPKTGEILWWSERSGKGQFFLYDGEGRLKNAVTPPDMVAGDMVRFDTLRRVAVFEGYGREKSIDPSYRFHYSVGLNGAGFALLTPGNGTHDTALFSPSDKYLIDTYSRMDMPEVSVVRDMKGRELVELHRGNLSALQATGWRAPRLVRVKADDGVTDLYGVMYVPFDLDESRKYPVISNVYPGPQDDLVPRRFTVDDNGNQTLAQLGFVVVNVAPRGSGPLRGKDFYTYGYGNLRDYPLADDKAVVRALAEQYSFIDTMRVGIYGHSGGGFMAATALMSSPEFYKVAVAASGNYDNNIYDIRWGEMYQGVKQVEKDGEYVFEFHTPTTAELASRLEGKLLLITGDEDRNVHPAQTLRLAEALIENGKYFDMMVLPGKDHGLGDEYYLSLIQRYFVENLLYLQQEPLQD